MGKETFFSFYKAFIDQPGWGPKGCCSPPPLPVDNEEEEVQAALSEGRAVVTDLTGSLL